MLILGGSEGVISDTLPMLVEAAARGLSAGVAGARPAPTAVAAIATQVGIAI